MQPLQDGSQSSSFAASGTARPAQGVPATYSSSITRRRHATPGGARPAACATRCTACLVRTRVQGKTTAGERDLQYGPVFATWSRKWPCCYCRGPPAMAGHRPARNPGERGCRVRRRTHPAAAGQQERRQLVQPERNEQHIQQEQCGGEFEIAHPVEDHGSLRWQPVPPVFEHLASDEIGRPDRAPRGQESRTDTRRPCSRVRSQPLTCRDQHEHRIAAPCCPDGQLVTGNRFASRPPRVQCAPAVNRHGEIEQVQYGLHVQARVGEQDDVDRGAEAGAGPAPDVLPDRQHEIADGRRNRYGFGLGTAAISAPETPPRPARPSAISVTGLFRIRIANTAWGTCSNVAPDLRLQGAA